MNEEWFFYFPCGCAVDLQGLNAHWQAVYAVCEWHQNKEITLGFLLSRMPFPIRRVHVREVYSGY